jgi:formylglycine-generating enzyme required for sulfatase activity
MIPVVVVVITGASFLVYLVTIKGTVRVTTTPSGVSVSINGEIVGVTADSALAVMVRPGAFELVLTRDGFDRVSSTYTIQRGDLIEIDQLMQRPGMVFVLGGRFEMGTDTGAYSEKPAHQVFLGPYYIDSREVTVREVHSRRPSYHPAFPGPDLPATGISWDEANDFCTSQGKRLPTEAEWERACRGSSGNDYAYGSVFDSTRGRTGLGINDGPVKVASYVAGSAGAFDMTGNVWEWNSDWYDRDYYRVSPGSHPQGPETGDRHVLRGGAWYSNTSFSKCTHRPGNIRSERDQSFGFRCAKDPN